MEFIGIPYVFNGDTVDGCDCAGLVRVFYDYHGWNLPTYEKPKDHEWYLKTPFLAERYLLKNFDKTRDVRELTYGDLVLMKIEAESHFAIFLHYNKVLSTFPPGCRQWNGMVMPDRSFIMHKQMWINGFIAGFKRRKE